MEINDYIVRKLIAEKLIEAGIDYEIKIYLSKEDECLSCGKIKKAKSKATFIIKGFKDEEVKIIGELNGISCCDNSYNLKDWNKATILYKTITHETEDYHIDNFIDILKKIINYSVTFKYLDKKDKKDITELEDLEGYSNTLIIKDFKDIYKYKKLLEKEDRNKKIYRVYSFNGLINEEYKCKFREKLKRKILK